MRKQRDIVWIVSGDRVTTVKNGWTDGMGRFPLSVHYNERKIMTQQEVMEALDKAGIDYDYVEGFEDSMHVIIKFEPEEKND